MAAQVLIQKTSVERKEVIVNKNSRWPNFPQSTKSRAIPRSHLFSQEKSYIIGFTSKLSSFTLEMDHSTEGDSHALSFIRLITSFSILFLIKNSWWDQELLMGSRVLDKDNPEKLVFRNISLSSILDSNELSSSRNLYHEYDKIIEEKREEGFFS